MESKALVKLTNSNVACRFFARTPSRILWMVNICEVVDLFFQKPFWFFLTLYVFCVYIYTPMDYFDGVEICELIGCLLLHNLNNIIDSINHSLYHDGGLIIVDNSTTRKCDMIRNNYTSYLINSGLS